MRYSAFFSCLHFDIWVVHRPGVYVEGDELSIDLQLIHTRQLCVCGARVNGGGGEREESGKQKRSGGGGRKGEGVVGGGGGREKSGKQKKRAGGRRGRREAWGAGGVKRVSGMGGVWGGRGDWGWVEGGERGDCGGGRGKVAVRGEGLLLSCMALIVA